MRKERMDKRNWVAAVFKDAAFLFDLSRGTTLAQLAERLGSLGEIHGELLLPVHVRVAAERPFAAGPSAAGT
jgi:hypothetical protein